MVPLVILLGLGIGGSFLERYGARGVLALLAFVVVTSALVGGLTFLQWRRLTFWFDAEGDFRLDSGVFTQRRRRLQLSRLQGVDVTQPLLARLVGLGAVTIEVAGAGDSRAKIEFLSLDDANSLRNEVIARAAGLRPESGEAPSRPLVSVPTRDLFVSLLLRGSTIVLLGLTLGMFAITVIAVGWAGVMTLVLGGVPVVVVLAEFAAFYNFTVGESADGLRIRSGLLHVRSQTIPPGRVQAVEFVQSWMWRRRDWVRVRLNVAGLRSSGDGQEQGGVEQVLLPVAPMDVALAVVGRVIPGVDVRSVPLVPAPSRARARAWIQFAGLGVGHDDEAFITTRGRFVRRMAVVPHARTQSVRLTQGPWERALGLVSMHVDSPPGPVRIVALHRDPAEARELAEGQNRRAHQALGAAGRGRWMVEDDPGSMLAPREDGSDHVG
ncbi:MAG: PH domain-containing protein [Candidatus Nanopelagicales bacterium]|nr:PH domain-containing protein [Candidatus Nanopelagicales bacterium]MDZ4249722.1 PH domain-containing protein [Candidatus Nanopelagicales bacterium]